MLCIASVEMTIRRPNHDSLFTRYYSLFTTYHSLKGIIAFSVKRAGFLMLYLQVFQLENSLYFFPCSKALET